MREKIETLTASKRNIIIAILAAIIIGLLIISGYQYAITKAVEKQIETALTEEYRANIADKIYKQIETEIQQGTADYQMDEETARRIADIVLEQISTDLSKKEKELLKQMLKKYIEENATFIQQSIILNLETDIVKMMVEQILDEKIGSDLEQLLISEKYQDILQKIVNELLNSSMVETVVNEEYLNQITKKIINKIVNDNTVNQTILKELETVLKEAIKNQVNAGLPVKGEDYFTEEDISKIVNQVASNLQSSLVIEIEQLENDLTTIRQEVNKLTANELRLLYTQLKQAQSAIIGLQSALNDLDSKNEDALKAMSDLLMQRDQQIIATTESQLKDLTADLQSSNAELQAQIDALLNEKNNLNNVIISIAQKLEQFKQTGDSSELQKELDRLLDNIQNSSMSSDRKELITSLIEKIREELEKGSDADVTMIEQLFQQIFKEIDNHNTGNQSVIEQNTQLIQNNLTKIEELRQSLMEQNIALQEQIISASNDLQSQIDGNKTDLQGQLDASREDLENQINSSTTALQEQLNATKSELQTQMDENKTDLQSQLDTAKTDLQTKIDANNAAIASINKNLNSFKFYEERDITWEASEVTAENVYDAALKNDNNDSTKYYVVLNWQKMGLSEEEKNTWLDVESTFSKEISSDISITYSNPDMLGTVEYRGEITSDGEKLLYIFFNGEIPQISRITVIP